MVDEEAALYARWWSEWRSLGILPYDGELLDQPAWVVDMLKLGQAASSDVIEKRDAERLAELKRKANGGA